jgi:Zn-dependent M28 family amino/carboxypeptidase
MKRVDFHEIGYLYHLSDRLVHGFLKCPAPFNRYMLLPFLAVLLPGVSFLIRPIIPLQGINILISAFSIIPVVLLLIIFVQMAFSKPSPGANDNASGILVLLELARRFSVKKETKCALELLATGAEEMGFFGIKHYLKNHRELDRQETVFINLECVGGGILYWATGEEHLLKISYEKKGIEIIEQLEKKGIIPAIPRTTIISPTDAGPITRSGYNSLTLIGLKESGVPVNYHTSGDTFDRLNQETLKQAADIIERIIDHYQSFR